MSQLEEEVETADMTPKGRLIRRVNLDVQKAKLSEYFTSKGILSFNIVETPEDYYSMTLDQRKVIVGCNKEALCKSVILENKFYLVILITNKNQFCFLIFIFIKKH